jgi:RHS repeat-associated protein
VAAGETADVPALASGDAPTPVPGAVPGAERGKGFDPSSSVEVVSGRDRFDTLFANADGTRTVVQSSVPVHFESPEGWVQIDSRLVESKGGGWVNSANSWHIRFPGSLGGAITFSDGRGEFSWVAVGASDVAGLLEADGLSVRYADAWSGADLVYRVTNAGVEELVELRDSKASPSYSFALVGASVLQDESGGLNVVAGELSVAIGRPEVFNSAGHGVDAAAALSASVVGDDTVLTLGVDAKWLQGQPFSAFPIVIDPTITPTLTGMVSFAKPGQGYSYTGDFRIGNPAIAGKPAMIWRAIAIFDYSTGANNVLGLRVTDASLTLTTISGLGSGVQGLKVFWADVVGYHDTEVPRTLPPPYPWGHSWSGQFGSGSLNGIGSTATISLTSLYDYWARNSLSGGSLLVKADNEPTNGTYTLKQFSASLSLTYSAKPSAPVLTAAVNPANGARWWAMPSYMATSQSTNAESAETVQYRVEFGSDAAFSQGVIQSSNWEPYASFPPVGALFLGNSIDLKQLDAGQTYFWRVSVTDGWYVVPSAVSRSFVWDPDPVAAPMHSAGPFSINSATGKYSAGVVTPSFASVGGPIGAGFVYTNADEIPYGLTRTVWKDSNANGVADVGELVVERHRVGSVDIDWGVGGPTADTSDYFVAEWNGFLTAVGSGWQLGFECDQKAKVWVNGALVLDVSSGADCSAVATAGAIDWVTGTLSTTPQSLRVQLVETTGTSKAKLWVRQGTGGPTALQSSWLTNNVQVLPVGWGFSAGPAAMSFARAYVDGDALSLFSADGSSVDWSRPAGSESTQGWVPEAGDEGFAAQGPDGLITVTYGGLTYLFNADGSIKQVVTAVDDQNKSAAALYTYDASGRVTKVQDPVSGRQLRMIYQGQAGCSTTPIPVGYLCVVQFARSDADATPETWTTLTYSGSTAASTLSSVVNFPDAANPNALDKNETWQFGYYAGSGDPAGWMNSFRDPTAFDAIRSSVWSGTNAETQWDLVFGGVDGISAYYWSWPTSVTAPATSPGGSRQQTTFQNVHSFDSIGFTDVKTQTAGMSPPAGYMGRVKLDSKARAYETYDEAGRLSSITWDGDDRVTTTIDSLGRRSKTLYDASGNAVEQWGPVAATNTVCWTALVARVDPATSFPTPCSDVPVVKTDYDFDVSSGAEFAGLDVTWWANSNLAPTATEVRPALKTLGVGVAGGAVNAVWGTGGPTGLKNAAGSLVTDSFSAEMTGVIVFPTTGIYTLKLSSDDRSSLWINDTQIIDAAACCTPKTGTFTATAGVRYRILLTYVEWTGGAYVQLFWTPPAGGEVVVPGTALHPNYGFLTRSRTFDTAGGVADEQTIKLPVPQYGQVSETKQEGLTTSYTNEATGTGWARSLTRTLPAGNSWQYVYYGDTATLTTATCGVATGTLQSGLQRKRMGPDPDDAGPLKRRIEEVVYDVYGHQRGSRVGLEGSTANELDATVGWDCIDSVDGRWRPLSQSFQPSATSPARTITMDYAKNANPMVSEVCDNNVTGSPTATTDSCNTKNGVITSTVDLLGRSVSYTDVWAKTTTTTYNQAGQVIQRVGVNGTETYDYTSEGQLWKQNFGGVALATLTYNTGGELKTIGYSNGTTLADLDVAGRRFSDRAVKELTFTGPGGTITSNTITGRDRNGRVTTETVDAKEYRYTYDTFDRLSRTTFGNTGFVTAEHDWQYCFQDVSGVNGAAPNCQAGDVTTAGLNSNRTAAYDNGVKLGGYQHDKADRLSSVSVQAPYAGTAINYDNRGNTVALAGETLAYDGADRHMATSSGANSVTYQRDALDRIVSRTGNDGITRYTFGAGGDTSSVVLDNTSTVLQSTIGVPGGVMVTKAGGVETWSYPNVQGSVVAIADAAGVKQGVTIYYDPFGNSVTTGAPPDNSAGNLDYGYLGQYRRPVEHNTGLRQQTEMGARGHDAALGRFLEADPIEGGVDNDYNYVTDPIGSTDLNGLCNSATITCIIGILIGTRDLPYVLINGTTFVQFLYADRGGYVIGRQRKAGFRRMKSNGDCSVTPRSSAFFFDFNNACKTHDLGYALLRFFRASSSSISYRLARLAADFLILSDMQDDCRGRGWFGVYEKPCNAVATTFYAFVTVNSVKQLYGAPG